MALRAASARLAARLRAAPVALSSGTTHRWIQSSSSSDADGHPKPTPLPKLKDNFLDGTSSTYLEELEERYNSDPSSVDKTWASFFGSLEQGVAPEAVAEAFHAFEQGSKVAPLTAASISNQSIQESMRLILMVRAYQVNGHFMAQLDPLGIDMRPVPVELDPALYGFSDKDLDREFFLGTWNMSGFLSEDRPIRTLREVLRRLKESYCGTIGYEYMHIPDRDRCNWLREQIETHDKEEYALERKMHMLDRLAWSEMFENFLANKFTAAKRFGLEGAETLIPGMKALIDLSADLGTESICIGMPHRGRLNILANVVRKPMQQIFAEFGGVMPTGDSYWGTGDVKYHLGTSYDRPTVSGKRVHLSLLANPSHLEAVDPVVLGKVRAKQYYSNDDDMAKNLPILIHGDGSFSGQGVVYETLGMQQLPEYGVGGCIHIVVNNQVAFTTDPKKGRSTPYCTDIAKGLNCPVFHVNGDDVEAVVKACELAAEWRRKWKSDVVIDLICYRKHGHNEIDEPFFTQPLMYQAIKKHQSALPKYITKLQEENTATAEQIQAVTDNVQAFLSHNFENAKDYKQDKRDWLSSYWSGYHSPSQLSRIRNTGVPMEFLKEVGYAITTLPEDINPHRQVKKVYEARRQMIDTEEGVDWGFAEALAFGTLLSEGNHVRLTGQDSERGTFSHRHALIHDQKTGHKFIPLSHVFTGQAPRQFTISNSHLSEYGTLGFELGYSLENPNSLVLWEAQFGDFSNTAQVIFDQFMSSGEAKWLRQNGLTVLLPHGYDGQGPEHSSARLERFLQMVDENPYKLPEVDESKWFTGGHLGGQIQQINWQVANCTTPANYFHLLRRQIHRQFRKPLVVMSPKALLRSPHAKSGLWEFDDKADDKGIKGVRFKRVIMDEGAEDRSPNPPPEDSFKRLIFCSGKVYYDLRQERESQGKQKEVALVRVEQLAPFPFDLINRELKRYPNAHIMWAQEEPMNMGAYFHIAPRLKTCLASQNISSPHQIPYAGRGNSASTATGYAGIHKQEQQKLLKDAMNLEHTTY